MHHWTMADYFLKAVTCFLIAVAMRNMIEKGKRCFRQMPGDEKQNPSEQDP